jgi:hypothetical protein
VAAESLRDELMSIPGVEAAEFDGNSATPEGVKVRLAAGVDVEAVGEEIQRVLTDHGLRSELAQQRNRAAQVSLDDAGADAVGAAPVATAVLDDERASERVLLEPDMVPLEPEPIIVLDSADRADAENARLPERLPAAGSGLEAVAVEEGRHGVLVRARDGSGLEAVRRSSATGRGLDEAVVAVVAELHGSATLPMIVSLVEQDIDGTRIVTVMLELGRGSRVVGSAVFDGGRAYAVGRAAWSALSSA